MKGIKLILLSVITVAMLTSCGSSNNNAKPTSSPAPTSTMTNNSGSNAVKDAGDATGNAVKDVGDAAGNVAEDAGDAVGDAAKGVGDAAKDVVEGAGDAVGVNDANNNGK